MGERLIYNISFDIAGVVLVCAMLVVHLTTYRIASRNNFAFRVFLCCSLVNGLSSIVTAYTISYASMVPDQLNMALNVFYQISACLTAYFGLRYVLLCLNTYTKIDWIIDSAGAAVYILVLAASLQFPIMFTFENHVYIKGPLYQMSYFVQFYYVLHAAVVMIVRRKEFARHQLLLNSFYVTVPITAGILQVFMPNVMLTFFGGTIAALFMVFSLETTDYNNLQKAIREVELARTEAQQANNAKSVFLARMSHEIRTPINGILGMNTMIMKETDDPEIADYASSIESASKNLLTIVNDILDLSKVESGKMELSEINYRVDSLTDDCFRLVSAQAQEKGLYLNVEIDPDLPSALVGDEDRLRQIIVNLLNNAVKYTERGGVILSISGKRSREAEDGTIDLVIRVTDTGIGIRDEQIDALFVNFERGDQALNRSIEGTGLGLPIVATFVDVMGGAIEVESEYGSGSCFTVTVPQRVQDEKAIGVVEMGRDVLSSSVLRAPNLRILVVDDMDLNLKVFRGYLKECGSRIDEAKSGRECLDAIEKARYDIIFMDHMMPDIDGIETYRMMKADSYGLNEGTPVVMMTANAIIGAREEYLNEGFADYLSKPLTQDELMRCIAAHTSPSLWSWTLPGATIEEPVGIAETSETAAGTDLIIDEWSKRLDFLDMKSALPFCGNNVDLYLELARDFVTEDRSKSMRRCFDEQNWNDYEIQVHALKSSAKLIGASSLSDLALLQERAAKLPDPEKLAAGHEPCMRAYEELRRKLDAALNAET